MTSPGARSAHRPGTLLSERSAGGATFDRAIELPQPLRPEQFQLDVKADGRPLGVGEAQPRAEFRTAGPEYFKAAGIRVLQGRPFLSTDTDKSQLVVVINTTLAERLFPGRDPIGPRIAWSGSR